MTLKQFLKEEWTNEKEFMHTEGKTPPICINPDNKDFAMFKTLPSHERGSQEAAENGEVRFLLDDKKKKVYIFPTDTRHAIIAQKLGLNYYKIFSGIAINKIMTGSSAFADFAHSRKEDLKEILSRDYSWADKYINITGSNYYNKLTKK